MVADKQRDCDETVTKSVTADGPGGAKSADRSPGSAAPAGGAGGGVESAPPPPHTLHTSEPGKNVTKGRTEKVLAKCLGLGRAVLTRLREKSLEEGADWCLDGRRVVYTPAGEAKVATLLAAEAPTAEETVLVVVRKWRNPTLLGCRKKSAPPRPNENGLEVCRVRDTQNFVAGMEVPAWRAPGESLWRINCPHPRWKGKY